MTIASDAYESRKQIQLSRRRRIIFNNDGGDAVKLPEKTLPSPEDFLQIRTTPLTGTHVDTVSYCSGIFGSCRHNTQVGHVFRHYESNVVEDLIERGTDPLNVMVHYCHDHGIEVFCSMRMNDTHDASRPERFRANRFKVEHPDCLLGTEKKRPKRGGWSAVNYLCEPVRDRALRFVEEVCRGYDIDGIELDFFRHPVFFKSTSRGFPAGDEERACMTDLMRKIQTLIREIGMTRGRPLLVAARTPDDVAYCNTIGLEIERWMAEGLIDIFIPSAYIRLNAWEDSVRLGHQHGVKVYPGLSESRVGGGHHANPLRASDECYRARALNAWDAGADGVYIFNLFDPHRRIWREMGEPDVLERLDKFYFASVRGVGRIAGGAYPHGHFMTIPTLNPDAPLHVKAGERAAIRLRMGEEFTKNPHAGHPEIKLHLQANTGDAGLTLIFNGRVLQGGPDEYDINPLTVRKGVNVVEIWNPGASDREMADVMISVDFTGEIFSNRAYLEKTRENM